MILELERAVQVEAIGIAPYVVPQSPRVHTRENEHRGARKTSRIGFSPGKQSFRPGRLVAMHAGGNIQSILLLQCGSPHAQDIECSIRRHSHEARAGPSRDFAPAFIEMRRIVWPHCGSVWVA